VGVQCQGENRRVASGVLEDELYAMQCEIVVEWPSLTIESVQGRMKRFTTARCPLAETAFLKAEGWKIDSAIEGKIRRQLGSEGCRHMAALMVECCRAVVRGELTRGLRDALEENPDLDRMQFMEAFFSKYPDVAPYARDLLA